ncbi:hypothetical protein PIB30_007613 [Stylosanthes scabra]|uniref:RNase H type-1 domain-containing protein n=1 Tax=Stylosanthes scabra TaxID=79078 RepID=A0ABU6V2V2_9FABA|nr:hypothetical protein [Stylosanthes scabra]
MSFSDKRSSPTLGVGCQAPRRGLLSADSELDEGRGTLSCPLIWTLRLIGTRVGSGVLVSLTLTQPKTDMISWLVDAIPTASFRFKRGLANSDLCVRCAGDDESRFGYHPPSNNDLYACFNWIRFHCVRNASLFCAIIRWVWRDRNNAIFSPADPWSLEKIVALCRHSAHEFDYYSSASKSTLPNALRLDWIPPHFNCVKLICDGNFLVNGFLAGYGCVIRGSDGVGFSVVLLIQFESGLSSTHYDVVAKIKDILLWNWSTQLSLIQRSANTVADYVARSAASLQQDYKEWISPSVFSSPTTQRLIDGLGTGLSLKALSFALSGRFKKRCHRVQPKYRVWDSGRSAQEAKGKVYF